MKRLWSILRDYCTITVGALLAALAVDFFLAPNNIVIGGVTGAAMLLRTFLGTPIGIVTLLANIPPLNSPPRLVPPALARAA